MDGHQSKISSSKKWNRKGTLRQGFNLSEAKNPEPHAPPPLQTVYVNTIYLFAQGRGVGEMNQREG
jgi:hypothetical protein